MNALEKIDASKEKELERIAYLAAERTIKKQLESKNSKHSRWLRNTKRLMEKYSMLKAHSKKSVSRIIDTDLEECLCNRIKEDDEYELSIDSIQRSELRTYIMVEHITKMLEVLKEIYRRKYQLRKYRVLVMKYIDQKQYSDIAISENIDERTIYRDINDALTDLSILLFGIDGMVD